MKGVFNVFLIVIGLLAAVAVVAWISKVLKRMREREERRKAEERARIHRLIEFWRLKYSNIVEANSEFASFRSFEKGYFASQQLSSWKLFKQQLIEDIRTVEYKIAGIAEDYQSQIAQLLHNYDNAEAIRQEYNTKFVKLELQDKSKLFDNIEGRKLDNQQRVAIVTDEDNGLIIAGAGSGKTTTIVGKVQYIMQRYSPLPSEILLISFTNKSAATLAARISVDGTSAVTFHKFGLNVITNATGKKPSIFDENQYGHLLAKFFSEQRNDARYLSLLTTYFLDYLKPPKSPFDFKSKGEYIQYIKDQNFRTYKEKAITTNGRLTHQMEVVKSIEECKIANFLLFNGVSYEYEKPYEYDTATSAYRQYKPDFTLVQGNKRVYIEHFAVSKNGDVPSFFVSGDEPYEAAKQRYWEKIKWARELHSSYNTVLIETYSYEMQEGTIFENLLQKLQASGIILKPMSDEEKWQVIEKNAREEINSTVLLFGTFINLSKSNNISLRDLTAKNNSLQSVFEKKRNEIFIQLIQPIYIRYNNYLKDRGEIDFNDMINLATNLIETNKFHHPYKYIIVDEFQDISIGRYKLLKAARNMNQACKLFCVGDDWQSIYRFTGSDIALFKNFQTYFGHTAVSKIETTYRYSEPVLRMSSNFILKNPNQSEKQLKPQFSDRTTTYSLRYIENENQDDTDALIGIFKELLSISQHRDKTILVLGRYSFDLKRLKNENNLLTIDEENGMIRYAYTIEAQKSELEAIFMTVHKAKGLEADIVIVLNCNSGRYGFPAELSDDPVLNLLLSDADQFENGEERRLFYVAVTRAKERVYLITDKLRKSKFINELEIDQSVSDVMKCPECKTADLVLRKSGIAKNGTPYKFYGCSNYLYGCEYNKNYFDNKHEYDNRRFN